MRHLTDGERYWFGSHLIGDGTEPDWDAGMSADAGQSVLAVLADYRAAIAASDAAIHALADPAALDPPRRHQLRVTAGRYGRHDVRQLS